MDARRWLAALVLALGCVVAVVAWRWRASEADGAPRAIDGPDVQARMWNDAGPQPELSSAPSESTNARSARDVENGITGRVVNAQSGEGLGGFWVKLFDGGAQISDTNSDELGWFRLPPPPPTGGRVLVAAAWGWFVVDATQTVAWREDQRYPSLHFHARPANVAKLHAQLFDTRTGELVPHYLVDVATRDSSHEHLFTDDQGVFETSGEYPEGVLRLTFNDIIPPDEGANERRPCYRLDLDFDGQPSDTPRALQIPVGPTYFIEIEAPPEVDKNTLGVLLRASHTDDEGLPGGPRTPLRFNELTWARFRPEFVGWSESFPHVKLGVRSRDGLWYGESAVDSTVGIYSRRVPIQLEARGHMLGRVRERGGAPIAGATVTLRGLDQRDANRLRASMKSSGNGLFEFELLPPGRYLVSAISDSHDLATVEVSVLLGRRTEPEITLDRAAIGGAIAGRLVAPHAPKYQGIKAAIWSRNPSGRSFSEPITMRSEGGRWIGEFRFDDVPAGDYELSLTSVADVSPSYMRVSPPAEGLEFTLLDPRTPLHVVFSAIDAKTGAAISPLSALLLSSGCDNSTWQLDREWNAIVHFGELDPGARWMVSADGYAAAWGDSSAITGLPAQPQVSAKLERGWGAEIVAFGPHFVPLEGVKIALDGEIVGATDADGVLRAQRSTKPSNVAAAYRDWHVDLDSLDEVRFGLQDNSLRLELYLAPP
jgi:hypothetical protein